VEKKWDYNALCFLEPNYLEPIFFIRSQIRYYSLPKSLQKSCHASLIRTFTAQLHFRDIMWMWGLFKTYSPFICVHSVQNLVVLCIRTPKGPSEKHYEQNKNALHLYPKQMHSLGIKPIMLRW